MRTSVELRMFCFRNLTVDVLGFLVQFDRGERMWSIPLCQVWLTKPVAGPETGLATSVCRGCTAVTGYCYMIGNGLTLSDVCC